MSIKENQDEFEKNDCKVSSDYFRKYGQEHMTNYLRKHLKTNDPIYYTYPQDNHDNPVDKDLDQTWGVDIIAHVGELIEVGIAFRWQDKIRNTWSIRFFRESGYESEGIKRNQEIKEDKLKARLTMQCYVETVEKTGEILVLLGICRTKDLINYTYSKYGDIIETSRTTKCYPYPLVRAKDKKGYAYFIPIIFFALEYENPKYVYIYRSFDKGE